MPARRQPVPVPAAAPEGESAVRARILGAARPHLFEFGYSAWTMDDLAAELGMSKKTLYRHFRAKDALVEEILQEFAGGVRACAEELFSDRRLTFPVKMLQFGEAMMQRLAQLSPHALRDLQRSAPHIYRHLEELRSRNIPLIFGQILREGQAAGMVRKDVDPAFAVAYWRPAVQSLLHPDTLEQLGLRPHEVMRRAVDLFFGGLLTPAGQKDYEKHVDS
jgi:AcrR family transcriptional regulator